MSDERDDPGPAEILLVEDNPGDVRLTKEALAEGQFDTAIHVASDGVEALDFLTRRGEYADAPRPDVVLLDLNLPRMDGDEVLAAIRDDEALRTLPVVVLTSSQADEDVRRSYELQANAYLTKPVDPTDFADVMGAFHEFWLSVARLPSRPD